MPKTCRLRRASVALSSTLSLAIVSPTAVRACGNLMAPHALDDGSGTVRGVLAVASLLLGTLLGLRRSIRGWQGSEGLLTSLVLGFVHALGVAALGGFAAAVLPTTQVGLLQGIVTGALAWIVLSVLDSVRSALHASPAARLDELGVESQRRRAA